MALDSSNPPRPIAAALMAKAPMSPKQQRFVAEYLVDMNATQAAIRAGYSAKTAYSIGQENLNKPEIAAAIAVARGKVAEKLDLSAERVIAEAWSIATADARELVEHRVGACRYCYGAGHRYQRTTGELERDRREHEAKSGNEFDEQGGAGFDPRREPHADCPECFGVGSGRTIVNDTRKLSPAAAALYAGVKQTKDGIEVRMHDKGAAIERLFRHLGLYDRITLNPETSAQLAADSISTLADQGRAVMAAVAAGDIAPGQAAQLLGGLGALAKIIETDELAARIAALEEKANAKA